MSVLTLVGLAVIFVPSNLRGEFPPILKMNGNTLHFPKNAGNILLKDIDESSNFLQQSTVGIFGD